MCGRLSKPFRKLAGESQVNQAGALLFVEVKITEQERGVRMLEIRWTFPLHSMKDVAVGSPYLQDLPPRPDHKHY